MLITLITALLAALFVQAPVNASITPETTGWRFRGGNVCVQDQTKQLSDGVWRAAVAWSKAEDINLIWRRSCAGFTQAQTITVQEYRSWSDFYYGVCDVAKVWTTGGYLKPGIVTRAAVFVNMECRTLGVLDRTGLAVAPLGNAVGLTDQPASDTTTAMSSCRALPTAKDYALVEQIYPW